MSKKKTREEFIREARNVHGDCYSYKNTVYLTNKNKVTIGCKEHGPFMQTPNSHFLGHGCPSCGSERKSDNRRKPLSSLLDELSRAFPEYDFSTEDNTEEIETEIKKILGGHHCLT